MLIFAFGMPAAWGQEISAIRHGEYHRQVGTNTQITPYPSEIRTLIEPYRLQGIDEGLK